MPSHADKLRRIQYLSIHKISLGEQPKAAGDVAQKY